MLPHLLSATRPVQAGKPIVRSEVKLIPLIRRGERVKMAGSVVQCGGRAEENGFRGQKIRVRADIADKSVLAVVTDRGQVRVVTAGPIPDKPKEKTTLKPDWKNWGRK